MLKMRPGVRVPAKLRIFRPLCRAQDFHLVQMGLKVRRAKLALPCIGGLCGGCGGHALRLAADCRYAKRDRNRRTPAPPFVQRPRRPLREALRSELPGDSDPGAVILVAGVGEADIDRHRHPAFEAIGQ